MITNGTANNDQISVATSGNSIVVKGLAAQVTVSGAESLNDSLVVNGGAGNDTIDASGSACRSGQPHAQRRRWR